MGFISENAAKTEFLSAQKTPNKTINQPTERLFDIYFSTCVGWSFQ